MEIGGGYDAYGSLVKNNVEEMHVLYNDTDVTIFFSVPHSSVTPPKLCFLQQALISCKH
jgi:hypothetical protein